jgi:hypothetical protein
MGALLHEIEVYISNENSLTVHALLSSIEAATKQCIWNLHRDGKLSTLSDAALQADHICMSGKKTLSFYDDAECPRTEVVTYDHTHTMERAVRSTCQLGFMLCDLQHEFCSRFIDKLTLKDKRAKPIGNPPYIYTSYT